LEQSFKFGAGDQGLLCNTPIFCIFSCMKKLYFILLLFPLLSTAQQDKFSGLLAWPPRFDSTARHVMLPITHLDLSVFFIDQSWSFHHYVVSTDSIYYKIFAPYAKDSLPVIDFIKEELVFATVCTQCVATCPTPTPCHRNACRYNYSWFVRDKRKPPL
jgi:hypothetical protein